MSLKLGECIHQQHKEFSYHLKCLPNLWAFFFFSLLFFLKLKLWLVFPTNWSKNMFMVYITWLSCTITFFGRLVLKLDPYVFCWKNKFGLIVDCTLYQYVQRWLLLLLNIFWTLSRRSNFTSSKVAGRNVPCSLVKTMFEIS